MSRSTCDVCRYSDVIDVTQLGAELYQHRVSPAEVTSQVMTSQVLQEVLRRRESNSGIRGSFDAVINKGNMGKIDFINRTYTVLLYYGTCMLICQLVDYLLIKRYYHL